MSCQVYHDTGEFQWQTTQGFEPWTLAQEPQTYYSNNEWYDHQIYDANAEFYPCSDDGSNGQIFATYLDQDSCNVNNNNNEQYGVVCHVQQCDDAKEEAQEFRDQNESSDCCWNQENELASSESSHRILASLDSILFEYDAGELSDQGDSKYALCQEHLHQQNVPQTETCEYINSSEYFSDYVTHPTAATGHLTAISI